jgi:hypothetical protein
MAFRAAVLAAVSLGVMGLGLLHGGLAIGMPTEVESILWFWHIVTFPCVVNFVIPV